GLTAIAVGLQRTYTTGLTSQIYTTVTANGLTSNELRLLNSGNIPELQLTTGGGSVDGTNTLLASIWSVSNKIIFDADNILANAPNIGDKGVASGLVGYATIFKALAIGNQAMFWEQIPAGTGSVATGSTFITRAAGYARAIADINNALATIQANPISPSFYTNVPVGINIVNTLQALKARYALFAGDYATALSAANLVDLSVRSFFTFDATNPNPIFRNITSTNNITAPTDANLGLPAGITPDPGDKRIPFYTSTNTTAPTVRVNGFGAASTTQYPIYLPGEITLIKAEAHARMTPPNLTNALIELNKVVTKKPADDPFGVGADLPPLVGPFTQAELLTQIYKHRSIELYMLGMRLEDQRRFGRPISERKRNFMPYPFSERDNNPNTPADPTL
ncbi:MAG TPA: RagB/SusD family protein, partial [Pedobacter sp.]